MNNYIKDNTSTNSNKTFNSKYSTPKFQSNAKSIIKSRDNSKNKIKEPKKMITPTNAPISVIYLYVIITLIFSISQQL